MKTALTIVITAAVTWFTAGFVHTGRSAVERLWLISAVKAPGSMALRDIQEDMNAGRAETAKAKIGILTDTWRRFDSGSSLFEGPGIGDIMVAFSKLGPASAAPVPHKP